MKIIGIVPNENLIKTDLLLGASRTYINSYYIELLLKANAIPIIIPLTTDIDILNEIIDKIDGVIISGGGDINPLLYGESQLPLLRDVSDKRDSVDLKVIEIAKANNKGILGICRGCQILNIAFGGTLYQDISYKKGIYYNHFQKNNQSEPSHEIILKEGSFLHNVLGDSTLVNSLHHQSIKDIGKNLTITARSKDGIIEGIECDSYPFILGVQWHPEMMNSNKDMITLISKFIEKL